MHILDVENERRFFYQFDNDFTGMQYSLPHDTTQEAIKPGMATLDWGCGNGHFSRYLNWLGAYTASFSFEAIPECMIGKEHEHRTADLSEPIKIVFPNAEFDAVFSIGVLEHVHEIGGSQIDSLKEIARILKPEGIFYCFHLPNKYSFTEFLVSIASQFTTIKGSAPHSKKFTRQDVEGLARDSGLEILDFQRYNFLPRNLTKRLFPWAVKSRNICLILHKFDVLISKFFPVFCNQIYFSAKKIST